MTSTRLLLSPKPCMELVNFQCSSGTASPPSPRMSLALRVVPLPTACVPTFRTSCTLGARAAFFL